MNDLANAFWIELRKATRSRVPLFTALGFLMLPLACGFLMFVYKNPDLARNIGLVSAKANLAGGSAEWPFYLNMFAQGISIGGILLFGLVESWVFGREFADGTLKDLLAVPVSRGAILLAKFGVAALWSAGLTAIVYGVGLLLGGLIELPLWSSALFWQSTLTVGITAGMVIALVFPVAFFASVGRGYLLPLGITFAILALASIVAVIGWGNYFPWSIPGVYAEGSALEPVSFGIVALTGLAGVGGTYLWWKYADQSR